jgi:hypothetical protein
MQSRSRLHRTSLDGEDNLSPQTRCEPCIAFLSSSSGRDGQISDPPMERIALKHVELLARLSLEDYYLETARAAEVGKAETRKEAG